MSDRVYRLILGTLLLVSLYFESSALMYVLIGMLFFEGITGLRVPLLVCKLTGGTLAACNQAPSQRPTRFNFEAERSWRLMMGFMLFVTYVLLYDKLWFVPWFLGFAIFGAGASGVCPGLHCFKWAGCR